MNEIKMCTCFPQEEIVIGRRNNLVKNWPVLHARKHCSIEDTIIISTYPSLDIQLSRVARELSKYRLMRTTWTGHKHIKNGGGGEGKQGVYSQNISSIKCFSTFSYYFALLPACKIILEGTTPVTSKLHVFLS